MRNHAAADTAPSATKPTRSESARALAVGQRPRGVEGCRRPVPEPPRVGGELSGEGGMGRQILLLERGVWPAEMGQPVFKGYPSLSARTSRQLTRFDFMSRILFDAVPLSGAFAT
eukprot:145573-Chlamydomonas_euryale.AAC.16